MVGRAPEEGLSTSSLVSLVPRQVMLESCSGRAAAAGAELAEKKPKKGRKGEQERRSLPAARVALLRAIAAFLEGSSFTRTLAALRSEAQLEFEDGSNPALDLEDIVCKYLESSKDLVVQYNNGPEEQDAQDSAPKEEERAHDHLTEPGIKKKKKKKVKGGNDSVEIEYDKSTSENGAPPPNQLVDKLLKGKALEESDHGTAEKQSLECQMETKDRKRKKSKMVSNESVESVDDEKQQMLVEEKSKELVSLPENASSLLDESNSTSEDKKKKKKNKSSRVANDVGLEISGEEKGKYKESERKSDSQSGPTLATEILSSENPMGKNDSKSEDKKKRKHKLIVESSSGYGAELQNGGESVSGKRGKSISHETEKDAKRSDPKTENISSLGNIDKKAKKRKISASEETNLHFDNDAAVQKLKQKKPEDLKELKDKEETPKLDNSLLDCELHTPGKKRKTEKSEDNSENSANTSAKEQSKVPKDAKEAPVAGCVQNEIKGLQQINGNLGNGEQEGNGPVKSNKAELKRSAEPKRVNAFQRVKVDEVKFVDERLQDNSYWAKNGAETGYGAKAQEVLGQVRGRDFRHEKTKKKRGSYRGGQIDFQSHSVKFQYSDDE